MFLINGKYQTSKFSAVNDMKSHYSRYGKSLILYTETISAGTNDQDAVKLWPVRVELNLYNSE